MKICDFSFKQTPIGQYFFNIESHRVEMTLYLEELNRKIKGFIYGLMLDNEMFYVGRTEQKNIKNEITFNRGSQHLHKINKSRKSKTKTHSPTLKKTKNQELIKKEKLHKYIYNLLSKDKDSCVEIVALAVSDSSIDLRKLEVDKMIEFNTVYPEGKNLILGGGGFSNNEDDYDPFESPEKEITDETKLKEFLTPIKGKSYRIVKNEDGSFSIPIPKESSELKNVIYRIKKDGRCVEVLYGKTEQTFGQRLAGYVTNINHSQEKLYCDIRANWTQYSVGIALEVKEKQNSSEAERYVIQTIKKLYSDDERKVLNKNEGRNGGSVCRELNFDN